MTNYKPNVGIFIISNGFVVAQKYEISDLEWVGDYGFIPQNSLPNCINCINHINSMGFIPDIYGFSRFNNKIQQVEIFTNKELYTEEEEYILEAFGLIPETIFKVCKNITF